MRPGKYYCFDPDYKAGYTACEAGNPFDEAQNDGWKHGYRDKEKERLFRSIERHLKHMENPDNVSCYALMITPNSSGKTEYICHYYGTKGCKCFEAILQDVLRLCTDEK